MSGISLQLIIIYLNEIILSEVQDIFFKYFIESKKKFFKKRLWHRCLPVNFAKFLRTPFLQNTSGRLLLKQSASYILFRFIPLKVKHCKHQIKKGW